jgi:hypothetical protein
LDYAASLPFRPTVKKIILWIAGRKATANHPTGRAGSARRDAVAGDPIKALPFPCLGRPAQEPRSTRGTFEVSQAIKDGITVRLIKYKADDQELVSGLSINISQETKQMAFLYM